MISKEQLRTGLDKSILMLDNLQDLARENENVGFFVFPFTLQGCLNVTETGIKPEALDINDYTFFRKVVSGDHPIVATWEDSTYFIGDSKRREFMQNEHGAQKKYYVGRYFKGVVESDIHGLQIASSSTYGAEMSNLQETRD